MDADSFLAEKAKEFLETRKNAANLDEIVSALDDEDNVSEAINLLKVIFMDLLKRRVMFKTDKSNEGISESEYIAWLKSSYTNIWSTLIDKISDETVGEEALITVFNLLGQEGKYPISVYKKGSYYFPTDKLQLILKKCYSSNSNSAGIGNQIDQFTNYIDVVYHFWIISSKLMSKLIEPKEKKIVRILSLLQRVPVPSDEELTDIQDDFLLCNVKNKCKFKPKYNLLQESIQSLWNAILRWNHSRVSQKKVLILLIETFLPHLPKPVLTMDYLMESLNAGGGISLLALQGIFNLVKDHNLEYPNIYGKLYSFYHSSIFYTKYKKRLYMLTNIFLSSTHLPESLVASFIKRFARLCLIAPPHDILILSAFIGNLLIRHPSLKILVQCPTSKSVSSDPFDEQETDPLNTKAIESSLWELETLQNHILPSVVASVSFINKPLPNVEWDLSLLLDLSYDDVIKKESRKNMQNVSMTFEKPESIVLPRTNYFSELWKI